jgi:hypothetical protein
MCWEICCTNDLKVCYIEIIQLIPQRSVVASAEIGRLTLGEETIEMLQTLNCNCYIMPCCKFLDLIAETHFLLHVSCFVANVL